MNIAVIGAGYVGSVTGAAFAAWGRRTVIVDVDPEKVRLINSGKSPIFEPGLDDVIAQAVQGGLLTASQSFEGIRDADAVFIAVGTPSRQNEEADLSYVRSAAVSVGQHLNPDKFSVVINKSTVPVGTADLVSSIIERSSALQENVHFAVVSNPEFLREGYALDDVFFPDRIVIGASHPEARKRMRELYGPLIERTDPKTDYFETDPKSAEMIKYVSNAYLSIKISYINEVARLCDKLGANVLDVAKGMGLDSRIGGKFLQVSSGWSGSCFPKDTSELLATSRKYGSELSLVKAAVESNIQMHDYCIEKVRGRLKALNGKHIGILGLTFKPDTDDARKTQASYIIGKLLETGAAISAHDPKGMNMFKKLNGHLQVAYCEKAEETALGADAIILLTHWKEYIQMNWETVYRSMRNPYVLDTRNFLDRARLTALGFSYEGIGVQ